MLGGDSQRPQIKETNKKLPESPRGERATLLLKKQKEKKKSKSILFDKNL